MEINYWPAEELRKEFDVIASFYQIIVGGQKYLCRNHAIIMRKGLANQKKYDGIVIMVNPGSCSVKDSSYQPPIIEGKACNIPYVVVDDDPTQRQLMRLMKVMNWNALSIINLSDLCSGNMSDFLEKLNQVEQHAFEDHSIFSSSRDDERQLLQHPQTKVILAWGRNEGIQQHARNAQKKLPTEKQLYLLPYSDIDWGFRHPNPLLKSKCIQWLKDIVEELVRWETIISIGGEGGSITLFGKKLPSGNWVYRKEVTEIFCDEYDDDPNRPLRDKPTDLPPQAFSWRQAIELLDYYPWPMLVPLEVHPEYRKQVWIALQQNVNKKNYRHRYYSDRLSEWEHICFQG